MARTYAPALTKQQFLQNRPKGSYSAYLSFLTRKRPGWDPTRPYQTQHIKPPQRGALPSYESMLRGLSFDTPAQMEARANRMAQQQIASQRGIIADEYKQMQDDAMRRMLAFQAAGRSAAAMNASLIGQVGSQYQQGADALSAMASAGAAQMAGGTGAAVDAANAAAANVGMPGVTVGGPVGQPGLAGPTQAGVESYRGGTLPAQMLTNAGGYAQAGMAGQISAQNLRATQEAQAAYMQAMGEAGRTRTSAIKELIRGRPSMAADYLLKLQDAQRQNYALAMSMLEGRRGVKGETFARGVTRQEQARADKELALKQKQLQASMKQAAATAARQGREVDEARSIALGYWVDAMGRPIRKPGSNKNIPVPKTAVAKTTGQLSPTEARRQVLYEAQRLIENYTDRRGNITLTRAQLRAALKATFPGYGPAIEQIIKLIPVGGAKTGGGGSLGAQP